MGRPRKPLDATADAKVVRARLKDKNLEGWQRQRLQAVLLGLGGVLSLAEIAREVGAGDRSISNWFCAFRDGGVEGLLRIKEKAKGPGSWLDAKTAEELKAELAKGQWRRAEDARPWLEKKLNRPLSAVVIYKYLGKCAARLKVPRPSHQRKDPARVEAFRAGLCDRLHAEQIALETGVHLWVSDEMRFGLQPVTRRVWTLRGLQPVVAVEPRYQWGYTYGALEVGEGRAEFLHTDGVSLAASLSFLEQIGQTDPEAIHIVIQDGAGFHQAEGAPDLPANVRVIHLPPYSPELNPVERLWDVVKDRICNRRWQDLDALIEAINLTLSQYWSSPSKVRSLIGTGFLHDSFNTSYPSVLAA